MKTTTQYYLLFDRLQITIEKILKMDCGRNLNPNGLGMDI